MQQGAGDHVLACDDPAIWGHFETRTMERHAMKAQESGTTHEQIRFGGLCSIRANGENLTERILPTSRAIFIDFSPTRRETIWPFFPTLRTTPAHRLEREASCGDCHDDVEAGAKIDRHGSGGVGVSAMVSSPIRECIIMTDGDLRRDDGAHNAHNAVEADGDSVAGSAMGCR